jgi:regulator of protease activity HflC (stomatin/prohibitin superfamily)
MDYIVSHPTGLISAGAVLVVLVWLAASTVRIIDQFQRGVVLTLGRYTGTREPGLNILIPVIQTMRRADIRLTVAAIPAQDLITKDSVSVKVTAVVYSKIIDAKKALLDVQDVQDAVNQLAQIVLRSTIGQHALEDLLSNQDQLNDAISRVLDERTKDWGVKIDHVEIRSVDLTPDMIRAMAQQAEAERGARARVITARGEKDAAQQLADAAQILSASPAAMTLRTLATMKEVAADCNSTIIFPVDRDQLMAPSTMTAAAVSIALRDQPPPST